MFGKQKSRRLVKNARKRQFVKITTIPPLEAIFMTKHPGYERPRRSTGVWHTVIDAKINESSDCSIILWRLFKLVITIFDNDQCSDAANQCSYLADDAANWQVVPTKEPLKCHLKFFIWSSWKLECSLFFIGSVNRIPLSCKNTA